MPGWARARLLITHKLATIGAMSCNPAIGGLGRGHLVREIDALDGVMARAIDAAASSFGCSTAARVRRCRARARRPTASSTPQAVRDLLAAQANLDLHEGEVDDLMIADGPSRRASCDHSGTEWRAGAVVLTTGTFLRGEIHLGEERWPAGRVGDRPSQRSGCEPDAAWACGSGGSRPERRHGWMGGPSTAPGLPVQPGDDPPVAVLVPDRPVAQPADRLLDHPHHAAPRTR